LAIKPVHRPLCRRRLAKVELGAFRHDYNKRNATAAYSELTAEEGSLKAFRIVEPEVCREIRLVRSPRHQLSGADSAVMKKLVHLATEETRKGLSPLRPITRFNGTGSPDLKSRKRVVEISRHHAIGV
jgi:hypothetical protein